ncbi:MAG: hypothetical protein QM714_03960 [Nocardioides sp.]|uniref:hypothetical protein n=1 Tax=Nocardioides sp. TaxID=35761 RepID=UPI0039E583A9
MHRFDSGDEWSGIEDLDARGVLRATQTAVAAQRRAEVTGLRLARQWAVLHGEPAPGQAGVAGGEQMIRLGGAGTPLVREFCPAELGVARDQHTTAARQLIADALDLAHRLPQCWAAVQQLQGEVWIARRIARLTHRLDPDQAALVDAAVAPVLGSLSAGRVLELAEAKIIEADPDYYATQLAREATRRCVHLSRSSDHGLRTIFARLDAGDATWLDAIVDHVADILATDGDTGTKDERRARALGWLARPAELLTLLLQHQQTVEQDQPADPEPDLEPEPEPDGYRSRATAFPTDLLDALRGADPDRLRPPGTVHVHLTHDVLAQHGGLARVEDLGPMLLDQLAGLLGHTRIRLQPVIDLADQVAVTGYEHPTAIKDRVYQTTGGDYFPYAVSTSRHVDYDHVTPYDKNGPAGQTGTHNSGPLTRSHHRIKTHHPGWKVRQLGPGTYLWTTPHGLTRQVDPTGTHHTHDDDGPDP